LKAYIRRIALLAIIQLHPLNPFAQTTTASLSPNLGFLNPSFHLSSMIFGSEIEADPGNATLHFRDQSICPLPPPTGTSPSHPRVFRTTRWFCLSFLVDWRSCYSLDRFRVLRRFANGRWRPTFRCAAKHPGFVNACDYSFSPTTSPPGLAPSPKKFQRSKSRNKFARFLSLRTKITALFRSVHRSLSFPGSLDPPIPPNFVNSLKLVFGNADHRHLP